MRAGSSSPRDLSPARIGAVVALLAPLAGCGACEPDRSPPTRPASSSTPSTHPIGPSAGAGATLPTAAQPRARTPCRAIAVDGEVRLDAADGGAALARQDEIAPGPWVWLSSSSRLVAKDPRTTRETTFRGPGHVKPCVGLVEESWITSGTFESTVGAGETPGAEEWVVTPVGVVRYGAAKLTVDAPIRPMHDTVRLEVANGVAFVWPARDASVQGADGGGLGSSPVDEGWARVSGGEATVTVASPRSPPDSARQAIEACRAVARSARDLASALVEGDADGTTAAAQVRARRLARAACAVATVRVDALPVSSGKESLLTALTEADGLWRSFPPLR